MNVSEGVARFCSDEWREHHAQEDRDDRLLVDALKNSTLKDERNLVIENWLRSYQVFQGLTSPQRKSLAANVVSFYDSKNRDRLPRAELMNEFHLLEQALQSGSNLMTKEGKPRRIESLTSKALWCCYPFDTPILDYFAEASLRVISRSMGLSIERGSTRYECFTDLWFKVYESVRPQIVEFSLSNGTYPVRVFDRYLWWLGQDSYEGLFTS